MNENDIYTMLQGDDNLREAIRHREQKQPPMPADLNERLMKRMEEPTLNPSPREGRTKSLRWLAAAACLLIIVGVGVTLMMPEEKSNEVALLKPTITVATSEMGITAQKAEARKAPKVVAVVESKPKAKVMKETTPRKQTPLPQEARHGRT